MNNAVLITGAAKRVGAQLALYFAKKGYDLFLHYNRSQKEMNALLEKLPRSIQVETIQSDFSSFAGIQKLTETCFKKLPHLNLLISNASLYVPHTLQSMTEKDFDQNISINLKAPVFLMKCFAEHCPPQTSSIINILDTNITKDDFDFFSYSLAKKALAHATRMAALEYAPHLRVNGLALGYVLSSYKNHESLIANIPMKRQASFTDLEMALDYLIKNSFVTGDILYCDGGKHLCL